MTWTGAGFTLGYTTLLGGSNSDLGQGIAVDEAGNAHITGYTSSINFPLNHALQSCTTYSDVFATRLNPQGEFDANKGYSTCLSGSSYDYGMDIAVDDGGNAYLTGYTRSNNFPTTSGVWDETFNGLQDAFLSKLHWNGSALSLAYSTFLGDHSYDYSWGVDVDKEGSAYVAGYTDSYQWEMMYTLGDQTGSRDVFVAKFSPDAQSLVYSTRLGGSTSDYGYDIAVDGQGHAYVVGSTYSSNFPADNAKQGSSDTFVTKLTPAGDDYVYSRFLGGSGYEVLLSVDLDASGNVYVAGYTSSGDYPLTDNAVQSQYAGNYDTIVAQLSVNDGHPLFSSYLGGESWDLGYGVAVQGEGHIYVTGYTYSTDFPTTPNRLQGDQSGSDAFFTRIGAAATKYYYAGGQLIAFQRSSGYGADAGYGLRYVFRDHLGSTSTIINGAGDELWTERYYPFGATRYIDATKPVQTDYRYTGQRFEDGLAGGLYDYRARYYDPMLGRFLQADTIVPEPGNPQALNRYSYVLNNALRYTDPSGHRYDPGGGAPYSCYNDIHCVYPVGHAYAGYAIGSNPNPPEAVSIGIPIGVSVTIPGFSFSASVSVESVMDYDSLQYTLFSNYEIGLQVGANYSSLGQSIGPDLYSVGVEPPLPAFAAIHNVEDIPTDYAGPSQKLTYSVAYGPGIQWGVDTEPGELALPAGEREKAYSNFVGPIVGKALSINSSAAYNIPVLTVDLEHPTESRLHNPYEHVPRMFRYFSEVISSIWNP